MNTRNCEFRNLIWYDDEPFGGDSENKEQTNK